jgi:transcriptional regulator with XRE-family HTH domain
MINKFKLARILEGRRQIEVAREAGIALNALSMIENGWLNPKPEQLEKLKRVLLKLEDAEEIVK